MRSHYLKAMDITVWRPRHVAAVVEPVVASVVVPVKILKPQVVAPASFLPQHVIRLVKNNKCVAWLLAEQGADVAAEKTLLQAMCQAMKIEFTFVEEAALAPEALQSVKVVVLLGEDVRSHALASVTVIKTHAPKTLLADPKTKREAWQALQQAMQLF